jgi:hypothetical protein
MSLEGCRAAQYPRRNEYLRRRLFFLGKRSHREKIPKGINWIRLVVEESAISLWVSHIVDRRSSYVYVVRASQQRHEHKRHTHCINVRWQNACKLGGVGSHQGDDTLY